MNMHTTKSFRSPGAVSRVAFVAAGLFSLRFVFFFLPYLRFLPSGLSGLVQDGTLAGALLGNAEHLVLFPIISAFPAPSWAKHAGYGWLVVDMATDIMALQGVSPAIYLALRYGGHISAALWVASASWQATKATRIIGLLYTFNIAFYSYVAHGSFFLLIPSAFLFPLWLVLVGRFLAREQASQSARIPAGEEYVRA
jgi:hypothetical protein